MDKNKQLPSLEVSQVNNAIFLHLNRQVPPINGTIINNYWREGETKHIGNKINPAWETAMNYFPKELKKVQLLELCMEEVRNKYFPHKPSRKTGLFVFGKDKKQIEYWIKKLTIFPQLREPKLILLKLTGKIHKGNFVSAIDEIGLNNYYESSFNYWNSKPGTNPDELDEYLFAGKAEVLKIIHLQSIEFKNQLFL